VNTKKLGLRELHHALSRRDFLRVAASVGAVGAGAVLLGGCGSDDGKRSPTSTPGIVVDPPPETTTIRLVNQKDLFQPRNAPLYFAEQLLAAEGFTSVQYIDVPRGTDLGQLAAGAVDIGISDAWSVTGAADAGDQLVILAGVQNSAFVIVGNDRVQSVQDLKGKRIWALNRDATDSSYLLMAALLSYVGIDVDAEVEFVVPSAANLITQFLEGSVDAGYVIRPYSTIFRNANIGHVVLDGMVDPPWSQYFGSMATANRDFVEKHPVATKRALRAILKATDVCAREPERVARYFIEKGITKFPYDLALDAIPGVSFAAWREFNPEDTVRFYALRLKEAGLVKSNPDELVARATDWRYLNEIKRELGVA
jgi:NitT/TauT family transport system substrate-binding protein